MRNIRFTPWHASWFRSNRAGDHGTSGAGRKKASVEEKTHWMLGILTALCLRASLAQAWEKSSLLPIVSGSDGSRV